jgi:hypothetical protein
LIEHLMGAYQETHAASHAFLGIQVQRNHVFEINQSFHFILLSFVRILQSVPPFLSGCPAQERGELTPYAKKSELTQRPRPASPAPISTGTAQRISFLTPEREVYVEEPVKFMAK